MDVTMDAAIRGTIETVLMLGLLTALGLAIDRAMCIRDRRREERDQERHTPPLHCPKSS